MKLIVEPDAGITPILTAIKSARKSIDVLIFRLDRMDVAEALAAAVKRSVAVRALIAHTNSDGGKRLRRLEMYLLGAGVIVSRTADDLLRYHGKMMIVDRRVLHLYGFNFTFIDIKRSRTFGITTRNKRLVDEAAKLFDADSAKQPYSATSDRFIVSPENAREKLSTFIAGARKQLLIYDPKVSDPAMVRLLIERVKAGVDVRIIGKLGNAKSSLTAARYPGKRLHVRAIVRDGNRVFLGSQSLRRLELDRRREVGIIVDNPTVVRGIEHVFEQDWAAPRTKRHADVEPDEVERDDKDRKSHVAEMVS